MCMCPISRAASGGTGLVLHMQKANLLAVTSVLVLKILQARHRSGKDITAFTREDPGSMFSPLDPTE